MGKIDKRGWKKYHPLFVYISTKKWYNIQCKYFNYKYNYTYKMRRNYD